MTPTGDEETVVVRESLRRIQYYVDGELPPDLTGVAEEHFTSCAECEEEVRITTTVKELVRRSCPEPDEVAPSDLRDKVVARLQQVTVVRRPRG
ncbi:zf-HC2 domain-containing protein [Brevibacterium litoralis]|uniref:zf-HC2 domain-containing protein n=1 Tax=Brevibacterium litoralis TaxID=3138935 RepID=UPI0032EF63E9